MDIKLTYWQLESWITKTVNILSKDIRKLEDIEYKTKELSNFSAMI